MKRINLSKTMSHYLALFACLTCVNMLSQAPVLIPYQAIARNAQGDPLANTTFNARFTIHNNTADGPNIWQETQTVSTNTLGLFTAQLGGNISLSNVDWSNGEKFMQVEFNLGDGFVDIGNQKMSSVPYALYANNTPVRVSNLGDTLWVGNEWVIIPGISAANPTSSTAHSCGIPDIHNPSITYGQMTDQQGNIYKTVIIGGQEWMAENLKSSVYRNGNEITAGLSAANWQASLAGAWQYYNLDQSNDCPNGKMYNWYAVNDARGICPLGWHVPNETDWSALEVALGGQLNAGNKMKATGSAYWLGGNANATNESGFSALASGFYYFSGSFEGLTQGVNYWSATAFDASSAWVRSLSFDMANLALSIYPKNSGFHVRCVRD